MHWTLAITALLVAGAMIGGVWRRGSLALTAAWGLGQIVYVVTGNNLPISLYWIIDPIVFCTVLRYYGSKLDAAILATFPLMWWTYFREAEIEQWWTLWVISSLQFFLAGPWPQQQQIIFSISHGPRRAEV